MDIDTGRIIDGSSTDVDHEKNTFTTRQLTIRRRYNTTVHASNSAGSATSYITISKRCSLYNCTQSCKLPIIIGTHDIIAATPIMDSNETRITTQYFEESSASGALYVLVFVTDEEEVDFIRSHLLALDRETSRDYTLPFSLSPGGYRVFVYDVEQDGTLPSGVSYPAVDVSLPTVTNEVHATSKGRMERNLLC